MHEGSCPMPEGRAVIRHMACVVSMKLRALRMSCRWVASGLVVAVAVAIFLELFAGKW